MLPVTLPAPLPVEGEERQDRIVPVPGAVATAVQPAVATVLPTREAPARQEQRVPTAVRPTTAATARISGPRHGNDGIPAMPTVTTAVAGFEPTTRAARRRTPMTATTNSGHLRPPSMDSARPTAETPPRNRRPALFAVFALAPAHRADGLHDSAEPLHGALPGGQLPTAMAALAVPSGVRCEGPLDGRRRDERIPAAPMPTSPGLPRVQRGEQKAHTQISSICGRSRLPWTFH
jgi:hypothetical protein